MYHAPSLSKRSTALILKGVGSAIPIMLCYGSVSFAIGVAASQAGLSAIEVFLLGLSFSGSGQSIAVQMLALGQPFLVIVSTAVIINLRYFLMSAVLAPHVRHFSKWEKRLFASAVTDEIFALHSTQFRSEVPPRTYLFAVNLSCAASWIFGGVLGCLAGGLITDVRPYGIDFAVPGMFIALLVLQLESRLMFLLAVLSAGLVLMMKTTALGSWSIILSTIICATIGVWLETQWKKR